jgi:hypothetical protein
VQLIQPFEGRLIAFAHRFRMNRMRGSERRPVTSRWPGSIIDEQLKIIHPLTNPTAHGDSASEAFDFVIPSLPGSASQGSPH